MPIAYKKNILEELKKHGYNTNRLRKEKLLAEGVIQSLREGKAISLQNIGKICDLLKCEPGDILVMVDEERLVIAAKMWETWEFPTFPTFSCP